MSALHLITNQDDSIVNLERVAMLLHLCRYFVVVFLLIRHDDLLIYYFPAATITNIMSGVIAEVRSLAYDCRRRRNVICQHLGNCTMISYSALEIKMTNSSRPLTTTTNRSNWICRSSPVLITGVVEILDGLQSSPPAVATIIVYLPGLHFE